MKTIDLSHLKDWQLHKLKMMIHLKALSMTIDGFFEMSADELEKLTLIARDCAAQVDAELERRDKQNANLTSDSAVYSESEHSIQRS